MIKKQVWTCLALVIMTGYVSGCHDKDVYDEKKDPTKQEIVNQYKTNFLNYVGGTIDKNHDWGFATATGRTRAGGASYDINDNYPIYYTSAFLSEVNELLPEGQKVTEKTDQATKTTVLTNYELVKTSEPFTFDIFCSGTTEDIEIGFYYYDPETQKASEHVKVPLIGNFVTDLASNRYFKYSTVTNPNRDRASHWTYPNGSEGLSAYVNGINDKKVTQVLCKAFNITNLPNGYRVGFYYKNSKTPDETAYTNKYLNNGEQPFFSLIDRDASESALSNVYVVGMEDVISNSTDFDCNDVLIAVLGENHVVPEKAEVWDRILVEDLNVHNGDNTDFDFNDLVLDVKLTQTGADCILQAAGATLQIRINGDNKLEVHKMFDVGQDVMVNTNATAKGLKGATREPVSFSLQGKFNSTKDIKIEVNRRTPSNPLWIELFAEQGEPASKICVDNSFKWPDERVSIKGEYENFIDWVKDHHIKWY